MEIIFNKEGEKFAAEFKVDADFNLHIERPGAGSISFFQKTSDSGEYAHIDNMGNQNYNVVFDADFTAMVWPKYIKVISEVMPTSAIVTTGGNVEQIGGENSGEGGESVFLLGGKSFAFQSGMTWSEYISSDYNNGDFYQDGDVIGITGGYYVGTSDGDPYYLSDLIISGQEYFKQK